MSAKNLRRKNVSQQQEEGEEEGDPPRKTSMDLPIITRFIDQQFASIRPTQDGKDTSVTTTLASNTTGQSATSSRQSATPTRQSATASRQSASANTPQNNEGYGEGPPLGFRKFTRRRDDDLTPPELENESFATELIDLLCRVAQRNRLPALNVVDKYTRQINEANQLLIGEPDLEADDVLTRVVVTAHFERTWELDVLLPIEAARLLDLLIIQHNFFQDASQHLDGEQPLAALAEFALVNLHVLQRLHTTSAFKNHC